MRKLLLALLIICLLAGCSPHQPTDTTGSPAATATAEQIQSVTPVPQSTPAALPTFDLGTIVSYKDYTAHANNILSLPPAYTPVDSVYKGYIIAIGDKYGLIDTDGTLRVPIVHDTLELVQDENHEITALIAGESIIPENPEEHFVAALYRFALLDKNGNPFTDFIYTRTQNIGYGYISASTPTYTELFNKSGISVYKQTHAEDAYADIFCSGDFIWVYNAPATQVTIYDLSFTPTKTISDVYALHDNSSKNYIVARMATSANAKNSFAMLDSKGNYVIPPQTQYEFISNVYNNKVIVRDTATQLIGLYDITTKSCVVQPRFSGYAYFQGSFFILVDENSVTNTYQTTVFNADGQEVLTLENYQYETMLSEESDCFLLTDARNEPQTYSLVYSSGEKRALTLPTGDTMGVNAKIAHAQLVSQNRVCFHFYDDVLSAPFVGLMDTETLKWVVPPGKYAEIYPTEMMRSEMGLWQRDVKLDTYYLALTLPDSGNSLFSFLDANGNVIAEGLNGNTYPELYGSRMYCQKGFRFGLADLEGNWIYSLSVFQGMED